MASLIRAVRTLNSRLSCVSFLLPTASSAVRTTPRSFLLPCCVTRSVLPPFLARHLSVSSAVTQTRTERRRKAPVLSNTRAKLEVLDSQVQRRGRVDREEVEELLALFKQEGVKDSQYVTMLLRCCGSLMVKVPPSERHQFFQTVWTTLQSVGLEFDISHYNAALRVQLENDVRFEATQILEEIEKKKLIPNRVTYQLLIARFCEDGDLEGARKILEYMNKQDMSISSTVFHSLMKGHMRAGDPESAAQVIQDMIKSDVEPNFQTFRTLMVGYAEKGDIDSIKAAADQAASYEVKLPADAYLASVAALVKHGHSEHIKTVLQWIPAGPYSHDFLNCTFQLVANGNEMEGLEVYQTLNAMTEEKTNKGSLAILRTMIMNKQSLDRIDAVIEKMTGMGMPGISVEHLVHMALEFQAPDLALQLIERMKSEGKPVRPHYYFPVYITHDKAGNIAGIYDAIKHASTHSSYPPMEVYASIEENALSRLQKHGESVEHIMTKFKEQGFSKEWISSIQAYSLMKNGQLKQTATMLSEEGCFLPLNILKKNLLTGYKQNKEDWESLFQLLAVIQSRVHLPDANGYVLRNVLSSVPSSALPAVLERWISQKLVVTSQHYSAIKDAILEAELPEKTAEDLHELVEDSDKNNTQQFSNRQNEMFKKSMEELEALYESAKLSGSNTLSLEKWMLSKASFSGDVKRAEELKAQLDSKGFIYNPELLRSLGFMAAKHKQNLEEALEYKERLEKDHPEFHSYVSLMLNILRLQLEKGNEEGGYAMMDKYLSQHKAEFEDSFYWVGEVSGIMQGAMKGGGIPAVKRALNYVFKSGIVKPGTYSLLEEYMRLVINSGDLDLLVETMEECVTQYNSTPLYAMVFSKLVEQEDSERLQKVVDCVSTVIREMDVLNRLMFIFVENGKPKQARKIAETPGLRAVMPEIINACDRFVSINKVKELEQMVDITKNMFGIDRDEMLFQLIRAHVKQGDMKSTLDVFHRYEEENILPKQRTLAYLTKVFHSKDIPLPFTPPQTSTQKAPKLKVDAMSPVEQQIWKLTEENKFTEALNAFTELPSGDKSVSPVFLVQLVSHLNTSRRHTEKNQLVHLIATRGDTDTIKSLLQQNLHLLFKHFCQERLMLAYAVSGRGEEIVTQLEADLMSFKECSSSWGMIELFRHSPHLIPRLEQMVDKCVKMLERESGKATALLTHLFNGYIITERFTEAENLIQKYPSHAEKFNIFFICKRAKESQNEKTLLRLASIFSSSLPNKTQIVFNFLIQKCCEQNDWKGALAYYKQAKADGATPSTLWHGTMNRLEGLLKENGQPIPWPEDTVFGRKRDGTDPEISTTQGQAAAQG